MMLYGKKNKGFTLVELMVVISIMSILSATMLAGLSSARKSSRVLQRISDMKRVQAALELYYANNRSYPVTNGWRGICASYNGGGAYTATNGQVIPGLAPTYIGAIPTDPQSLASQDANCYLYYSNGTDYAFLVHQVAELYPGNSGATYAKYPDLTDPNRPTWAWKISSPGGTGF